MGKILVRAVRAPGTYPFLDHNGNKIPESIHVRYPATKEYASQPNAGQPFEILEEDFSPVRRVNGVDVGWMERVDGGPNELPKKAPATAEEADASPKPIPHIRREKAKKLNEAAKQPGKFVIQ